MHWKSQSLPPIFKAAATQLFYNNHSIWVYSSAGNVYSWDLSDKVTKTNLMIWQSLLFFVGPQLLIFWKLAQVGGWPLAARQSGHCHLKMVHKPADSLVFVRATEYWSRDDGLIVAVVASWGALLSANREDATKLGVGSVCGTVHTRLSCCICFQLEFCFLRAGFAVCDTKAKVAREALLKANPRFLFGISKAKRPSGGDGVRIHLNISKFCLC